MANVYTSFVKENYAGFKEKNPDANSKDILRLIAADWNAKKPPKEVKSKKAAPKAGEPLRRITKVRKPKAVSMQLNGDSIEDSVANIEDAIQRKSPPVELAEKVLKPKPKTATKKRKTNATEEVAPV